MAIQGTVSRLHDIEPQSWEVQFDQGPDTDIIIRATKLKSIASSAFVPLLDEATEVHTQEEYDEHLINKDP
jgi:hypothetical protein